MAMNKGMLGAMGCVAGCCLFAGELQIGWGRNSIAPEGRVIMPGYGNFRMADGVADPIYATALILDNQKDMAIFLSLDLVNSSYGLYDEIVAELKRIVPEIPEDKLLLNGTHPHSSAGFFGTIEGVPEELGVIQPAKVRQFIAKAAAQVVKMAWKNRKPGGVAWGYGLTATTFNRRMVYSEDLSKRPEGDWASFIPDAKNAVIHGTLRDRSFLHYEAGTDNYVQMLYTFDRAGKLTGAIVNMCCTSQLMSSPMRRLTSDLWHDVRKSLTAAHPGIFILPQCSAAGDTMPYSGHFLAAEKRRILLKYGQDKLNELAKAYDWPELKEKDREFLAYRKAMCMEIAERVSHTFDETLNWARKEIHYQVPLVSRNLRLELTPMPITEEVLAQARARLARYEAQSFKTDGTLLEQAEANFLIANGRVNMRAFIARAEKYRAGGKFKTNAQIIRVGDAAFASNGFELFMDYMHRIQGRSPFIQTFVVELAGSEWDGNNYGGYLPTARAIQNGGYSATPWQCRVGDKGGQELVEATLKALEDMHK